MLSKNDFKKICKQLKEYGFKSYKDFLGSDLWKEFRRVLYTKDLPELCSICRQESEYFHLHHKSYKRLVDPELVVWICDKCHREVHQETDEAIQRETDKLFIEINGNKYERRQNSLRVIPSSGLPAVLHHSMHASGLILQINEGKDAKEVLRKYEKKKRRRKDTIIIELLEENRNRVLDYLRTFTTN
jgi:hypothetical protein